MGLKKCDKCDEMVDEAKAFCPGCGSPFIEEEKRPDVSSFERLDNTVQLGNTMYNQMLSDMGLNISKASEKHEKRIEIIAPIDSKGVKKPEADSTSKTPVASSKVMWIVIGAFALLILVPFAVAALIILTRAIMARY